MSSPVMVPMISPTGKIGDVPQENVGAAVQAGFKIGAEMISPKGKLGVIPIDQVVQASQAGFMLKPPPMPQAPQPQMRPSYLAAAISNSPSGADPHNPANPTQQGLGQMSPEGRSAAEGQLMTGAAMTIPVMGAAEASMKGFSATLKALSGAKGKEEMMSFLRDAALKGVPKAVGTGLGIEGTKELIQLLKRLGQISDNPNAK